MTYKLIFEEKALKEWKKLGKTLQTQFKTKLKERLENPHVSSAKLQGFKNLYKIKLRAAGYRLVYEVNDLEIKVIIIAIGKRERLEVYKKIEQRHIN